MSNSADAPAASVPVTARPLAVLRLLLGATAAGLGLAVLVWPDATARVAGALFGLYLLTAGLVRAVLGAVEQGVSVPTRVLSVVFGALVAALGVACLRHALGSAVLYVLVVGIGWLLDGILEVVGSVTARNDPARGRRTLLGLASMLAATAVLVWPQLSLGIFLAVGAVLLLVVGVVTLVGAARDLRATAAAGRVPPSTVA